MQTYLQSTDLFFIRPLFESMCRDNYNDICIQYFNSFILPRKEFDPEGVKQLMEKIINKYGDLIKFYNKHSNETAYQDIVNYVRDLNGQISEEDFRKLMDTIKNEIEKLKAQQGSRSSRERAGAVTSSPDTETINELTKRIEELEKAKSSENVSEQIQKQTVIVDELKDELNRLDVENKVMYTEILKELEAINISEINNKITELESLVKALEESNQSQSNHPGNLKDEINKLKQEIEEFKITISKSLTESINRVMEKIKGITSSDETKEENFNSLRSKFDELERLNLQMAKKFDDALQILLQRLDNINKPESSLPQSSTSTSSSSSSSSAPPLQEQLKQLSSQIERMQQQAPVSYTHLRAHET